MSYEDYENEYTIRDFIRENYKKKSDKEIAEEWGMGMKYGRVTHIRRTMGLVRDTEIKEYIKEHYTEANDGEMALELGTSRSTVQKWRVRMKLPTFRKALHLCWSCAKATDYHKCIWVDKFELPEGAKMKEGNIEVCPIYERG